MGQRYLVANGAMPTTAALTKVTTGTAIKTMLQLATSSGNPIWVEEWGISFDGSAAATPIQCELIETGAVAATVTAHVTAGVMNYDLVSDGGASTLTLGTSATGYTATAEGSITATRLGDIQLVAPSSLYVKQFPLGREFLVPPSRFLRVRVTAGTAVNCWTYVVFSD
jgi:hypothetical protein